MDKPKVICFCGSTRFTEEMLVVKWEYEKKGIIVLTWNVLPESYINFHHKENYEAKKRWNVAEAENCKEMMDELHKRKIDLSDSVLIINLNDYIGESTKSEIGYAFNTGKPVKFLEPHFGTI